MRLLPPPTGNHRWQQYQSTKEAICKAEGSVAAFAEVREAETSSCCTLALVRSAEPAWLLTLQGYLKMGFNRAKGAIVYREWAPAAQAVALIGDFNGWKESFMQKDQVSAARSGGLVAGTPT